MRANLLWLLLPEGIEPLLIVGIAFALILGLTSIRGAGGLLLGFIVLPALLGPFVSELVAQLPPLVLVGLLLILGLGILKAIATLILGQRAAAEMTGILAADIVRWCVFAPFRLLRWLVGRGR